MKFEKSVIFYLPGDSSVGIPSNVFTVGFNHPIAKDEFNDLKEVMRESIANFYGEVVVAYTKEEWDAECK